MRKLPSVVVAGLALGLMAEAQDPPAFDVASLKIAQPMPPYPVDLGTTNHDKVTLTDVTFTQCLRFALNIRNDRQIDGPAWIKDHNVLFNIVAKAGPDTPRDQVRRMVLTLLTERFRMTLHHEQRELPYLAVTVDAKRLNLSEGAAGQPPEAVEFRSGRMVLANESIPTLLTLIGQFTSEILVDQTGLRGVYNIKLEWTPAARAADSTAMPAEPQGPTLFDAIEAQLGLKLDRRKGPLDVVVVDHADQKPIEN